MRPSKLLGLESEGETTMFDFDFLCAYRLDMYELDARKQLANRIIRELSAAWKGQPIED